jgi:IPT/TIG domain
MRPLRGRAILLVALPLVMVAGVAVAVASGHGGRRGLTQDASTSSVRISTDSTRGSSPDPATTQRRSTGSRIIQWLNEQAPLGGGASGAHEDAYYSLMEGDCAHVLALSEGKHEGDTLPASTRTLYEGVASACLAAFEDRALLWPRAEAAFEKITRQAGGLICEERAVYELLQRLIGAHRAAPSAQLVKRLVGRRALPCPSFTRITPNHGPAEGGYTVRLEGEHLPPVVGVQFGEHHLNAEAENGRHVVITVPPATSLDLDIGAYVVPDGSSIFRIDDGVDFTYDPPGSTTRPATTTSTTTPQVTVPTSTTTPSPPSS